MPIGLWALAYIDPPQDQLPTFEWLLWAMERQAQHRGRNIFVIDPWNELMLNKGRSSTTEHVAECIIRMHQVARRHNLILIVGHHTPIRRGVSEAPDKYALADSAAWANKSDHLITVWKPEPDKNETCITVCKSKDFELLGSPGNVWVGFNTQTFDLIEIPTPIVIIVTLEFSTKLTAGAAPLAIPAKKPPIPSPPSGRRNAITKSAIAATPIFV